MLKFLTELWEGFLIAQRAIRVHKLRASLTTLGIVIGIISVTAMATVINGIEKDFEDDMTELGTDVLYIEKFPWVQGPSTKFWELFNRPEMSADLAETVQKRSQYAVAVVPVVSTARPVRYRGTTLSGIRIQGSTAHYPRVHVTNVDRGHFFTDLEDRSARNVCVIGAEVGERLFPSEDPLNKNIRIAGHRFRVIGIMEKKGSSADGPTSTDLEIKMPYNTFKRIFGVSRRSVSIQVKVEAPELIAEATDELTGIMRVARGLDALEDNNFEINEQQSLREQLAPIKLTIYSIGLFLTALALVVGGIGVMNIMFVSVKERTREIGIRKAVGAKRRTILIQFLIEAIIVCLIGGAIGMLISLPIAGLIRLVLPAFVDLTTILLAFGICVFIGIVFGLAPAWTAAKAEPIVALRYE